MRDDPQVISLVERARHGDGNAWAEIVERYAPLIWSICRRFDLSRADTDDVAGSVWLALVEHLINLRDPAALPGWVATTTHHECLRILRLRRREQQLEELTETDPRTSPDFIEQEVLIDERNVALRTAFAQLPLPCRQLLSLLLHDPPMSYAEISSRLGISVGSIGPTRARCLDKLRCRLMDICEPADARAGVR